MLARRRSSDIAGARGACASVFRRRPCAELPVGAYVRALACVWVPDHVVFSEEGVLEPVLHL